MNATYSAIQKLEEKLDLNQERLARDFMAAIQERMAELQMNQTDIAYVLGKSRAYISKVFTKQQNMTIRTMVEISSALELDMKFDFSVPDRERRSAPNVVHLDFCVPPEHPQQTLAGPKYWEQHLEEECVALEA